MRADSVSDLKGRGLRHSYWRECVVSRWSCLGFFVFSETLVNFFTRTHALVRGRIGDRVEASRVARSERCNPPGGRRRTVDGDAEARDDEPRPDGGRTPASETNRPRRVGGVSPMLGPTRTESDQPTIDHSAPSSPTVGVEDPGATGGWVLGAGPSESLTDDEDRPDPGLSGPTNERAYVLLLSTRARELKRLV
jgi:hypothetical protein